MTLSPFGKRVRELRIVADMFLGHMAEEMKTTPAKLSAMETGRAPVLEWAVRGAVESLAHRGVYAPDLLTTLPDFRGMQCWTCHRDIFPGAPWGWHGITRLCGDCAAAHFGRKPMPGWRLVPNFECHKCLDIFVENRGDDYRCTSCEHQWVHPANPLHAQVRLDVEPPR